MSEQRPTNFWDFLKTVPDMVWIILAIGIAGALWALAGVK